MQTPQEILASTAEIVENFLKEANNDYVSFNDGSFTITRGSASVMVIVRGFTDTSACVEFISNVVSDGTVTPEVMEFLLRKNSELHFGAFGLLFDGTVTYSYTMPANNLTIHNFNDALNAVAIIVDYYDDALATMTQGKRAADITIDE